MNPQAVTAGARVGRRLTPVLLIAATRSPDPVNFFGGIIASVLGGIAGAIGAQTTAELVRIALERLDGTPQLALPPGVRLQAAAARATVDAIEDVIDPEATIPQNEAGACALCYGDGWIEDTVQEMSRCRDEAEQQRFMARVKAAGEAGSNDRRIACPRCQADAKDNREAATTPGSVEPSCGESGSGLPTKSPGEML